MLLGWFDSKQATALGIQLADEFATQTKHKKSSGRRFDDSASLNDFFSKTHQAISGSATNFFKKAKLANSFKWRLLERGIAAPLADRLTQTLITQLSIQSRAGSTDVVPPRNIIGDSAQPKPAGATPKKLLSEAADQYSRGDYLAAVSTYESLLRSHPRLAIAANNICAPLCKLGRRKEAEAHLRKAISLKRDYADAHANLGSVLRGNGEFRAAEAALRKALKLQPTHQEARINLGLTLQSVGRSSEAKAQFQKILQRSPSQREALLGMGNIAASDGEFDAAEELFRKVLASDPNCVNAWAALVRLRKMNSDDMPLLQQAEKFATTDLSPDDQATLQFGMGKFHDDIGDYPRAFNHYRRANETLKGITPKYVPEDYAGFVDYVIANNGRPKASSDTAELCLSIKPVFVVGMMRSGTSLMEQIIASHPAGRGAGELDFWTDAIRRHGLELLQKPVESPMRTRLAAEYLELLEKGGSEAARIVDKTPVNSDYLGLIHSIFPNARIIYMNRHPIDTCLSCYFQQFAVPFNFTLDLADLAHYYRHHRRLFAHWRRTLPADAILEVPYEALVENQESWTRQILNFIDLPWDDRCMSFHSTARTVATASYWQVRQKVYRTSAGRWRNYEKFIAPLRDIEHCD